MVVHERFQVHVLNRQLQPSRHERSPHAVHAANAKRRPLLAQEAALVSVSMMHPSHKQRRASLPGSRRPATPSLL
jgi:hypothetical protein